ncbi:septum site-determining protein Ssd [Actinomadura sp. CNU-125]|uniref:septum site-determining protein Ssd n=1 Tax=Actinomadura sp. CNU-125 TaxID=1904961 RepID=UPI0021CD0ED2|nr:septum site-determining protein Ssd [Actinomadura sp. CNU-125]
MARARPRGRRRRRGRRGERPAAQSGRRPGDRRRHRRPLPDGGPGRSTGRRRPARPRRLADRRVRHRRRTRREQSRRRRRRRGPRRCGLSVLATTLAVTAAGTGLRTLLADADPFGGGVDLLLGLEEHEGVRWPDLAERRGRLGADALRETLPGDGDLSVLSWRRGEPVPLTGEAVTSLFEAALRGFDLVVADVPRYPGELGRAALRAADVTYLLVPAEVRATVAADGLAAALRRETTDLRLVVQGPSPGGLTSDDVVRALGLPSAGAFDRDRRLPAALDEGELAAVTRRGPLTDFCRRLLDDLSLQPCAYQEEAA